MGSARTATDEPPAIFAFGATMANPSTTIAPPPWSLAAISSATPAITLFSPPGAQAPFGHARLPKSERPPGISTLSA
ncbi:MAG: hypothetical protein L6Q76_24935 [Polyangiaceae bacterium]|nr:hypothetical protein [Polyangiaceae bacterium]